MKSPEQKTPVVSLAVLFSCLTASSAFAGFIVGGEEVTPKDPIDKSIVALYQESAQGGTLCTATLIAKDMALTAAHCVEQGTDNMYVVFGDDVSSDEDPAVRVAEAEVPREWKEKHSSDRDLGDIAVIRLEGRLPKGYRSARMASSKVTLVKGQDLTLAGYGINDASEKTGAGTLRKTTVAIADPNFGKTEMLLNQKEGSGACHGDSGGPAFVEQNGKLLLLGVTNRGYPSSAPDDCRHEVVYAKVTAYRKWITQTIRGMRPTK